MPLFDERQILQKVLNATEDRIKVEINATVTAGAVEVAIDQTTDSIKIGDGTDIMAVNPDGSINAVITGSIVTDPDVNLHDGSGNPITSQVSGSQRALDVGINIAGIQVDPRQIRALTSSDSITVVQATGTNLHVSVDNFPATQPISAVALPLPTGASTSALQSTSNASLASIDSKLTNPLPVSGTVTANAGTGTFAISAATLPLPSGAATSALQTTGNTSLASIDGKLNSLGQKTMTGSVPVVIASDQTAITVTGTITTSPNVNIHDGSGTSITSQANGAQRALDVGINVAGVQVDPRSIRALTSSDTLTVVQPTGTNLHTVVDSGTITANAGTGTFAVSAASLPLPTGAATETTLAKLTQTQASTTSGQSGPLVQGAVTTAAPSYTNGQTDPLSLTTAGALRVDGSGVTQPISAAALPLPSGASTSALQTTGNTSLSSINTRVGALTNPLGDSNGSGGVSGQGVQSYQSAGVYNSTPLALTNGSQAALQLDVVGRTLVNGSGVTQPISAASLPLPSGAATETTLAKLPVAQASTTSGQSGPIIQGAVTTAAPTYTTAQTNPLSLTTAGALRTDSSATTQPISGTVTANAGTNLNTSALALDATLTGGTQKTKIVDTGGTNVATVSAAGAVKVDGSAVTQPISGSVTVSGTSTVTQGTTPWVENVSQFGGTNISTGTGTSGAGIPRVTISSDSSLAANQSVNVAQMNGVTVSMGAGTTGTGVQRVVLPTDQSAIPVSQSGTWTVQPGNTANTTAWKVDGSAVTQPVSIAATVSENLAQVGGNTVLAGNGVTGTGSQRVTIASDNTAFSVNPNNIALTTTSGTLANSGDTVQLSPAGAGTIVVRLTGTWVGSVNFEGSANGGTSWDALNALSPTFTWASGYGVIASTTINGVFNVLQTAGYGLFRVRAAPWTSGSATVNLSAGNGHDTLIALSSVDTNFLAKVSQGTAASAANAWTAKITDGTNTAAVKAASTAAGATDPALVVAISPNNTVPVSLAANQSVNVAQINGITPLMGNGVTGTGSHRVTIASDNTAFSVNSNTSQVNGVTTLVGNGVTGTGSQRVTIASDNTAFSVNATPPTLTKGTQGATGYSVQNLNDAGRTSIIFSATAVAAGTTTTETAITLVKSSGTGATSSAVSFVVTSGKRFRITNITVATRGNATATAAITTFNFRLNTGGAVTTASTPILFSTRSGAAATASAYDRATFPIPEGYEILGDGTLQIGMTAAATYVTNAPTWDVNIIGYEY